jgi:hypothetical protein
VQHLPHPLFLDGPYLLVLPRMPPKAGEGDDERWDRRGTSAVVAWRRWSDGAAEATSPWSRDTAHRCEKKCGHNVLSEQNCGPPQTPQS